MMIRMRAVAMLTVVAAGCAGAPRTAPIGIGSVETGAGTVEAARKYLEGRWSLLSYEFLPPGRTPFQVKNASGTLTYDAFGNLDMQLRVDDPKVAEDVVRAGVPLTKGVFSTSGRTAIDLQARTLTYFVEGQGPLLTTAQAGPLAMTRPRHWQVEGNVLTLTINGDNGQPIAVGRWQKSN
jgi:hypothetical protein